MARALGDVYVRAMRSELASNSRSRGASRLRRLSLTTLLACASVSVAACGGAVGDDVAAGSDASHGDALSDAGLGDTRVGDAPLFPTEDSALDGGSTGDASKDSALDAADAGAAKTCATDGDCTSVAGAHTCCGGHCVDTASNLDHCGGCSQPCRLDHATGSCIGGSCAVSACTAPWKDCNGTPGDGCEIDTSSSASNCGSCGHACTPSSGIGACAASACAITSCPAGTGDCNHAFGDGCEANLATDPNNCGACGNRPAESCNLVDDNCNGKCDDVAGCRVGVSRSVSGSTGEHFYSTSPSEAACCGFTVEYSPYYYLYASAQPGLVPFYRCVLGSGFHFYTTSSVCEGSPGSTMEGQMGWIGTSAACGATPLYRLAKGNDHFFTTATSERDSAIASGYVNEGSAGYVWLTPQG
jgi:hypothetical protein